MATMNSYGFSDINDNLNDFYNEYSNLMSTDMEYSVYAKQNGNKEDFMNELYNLVVTMNDIYRRAPYYNFDKITNPMSTCIKCILDEMEVYINARDSLNEEDIIINNELSNAHQDSRDTIKNYYDKLGEI